MPKKRKFVTVDLRLPTAAIECLDQMIATGLFETRDEVVIFLMRLELLRLRASTAKATDTE